MKMKRFLSFIICITMFLILFAFTASAADISVYVNGSRITFDQEPVIFESRTLVPIRAIFEALGAYVEWDGETSTVKSSKDGTNISLQIGSTELYVNGAVKYLDVPARIVNSRTLVPVRAVSEAYGCVVNWDAETYTVNIYAQNSGEGFYPGTNIPTYDSITGAQFIRKSEVSDGYYVYKYTNDQDVINYINAAAKYGWIEKEDLYNESSYGYDHFLWNSSASDGFSVFVHYDYGNNNGGEVHIVGIGR